VNFVSSSPLHSLRRLELANCWFVGLDIEEFLKAQEGTLLHTHFKHRNGSYYETYNTDVDPDLKDSLEYSSCSGRLTCKNVF
jgi:hypothetical protein